MTTTTTRRQAIVFISLTVFLWGIPALFIRYFSEHVDANTQNFWRYFSALVFLVLYAGWSGEPRQRPDGRAWLRVVTAATCLVVYQTFFTNALYHALPGFITLLIQLELIVALGLSCLFFADERHVARSPRFIAGGCAALAGAVGMVVFSPDFTARAMPSTAWEELVLGVVLVGGAAAFWGTYSVAIKWCLQILPPFAALLRVEAVATLMLLALLVLTPGRSARAAEVPSNVALLLFLSGVACIAVAHILYTRALSVLGVAACNTAFLATCVVAAVLSRVIFDERLTWLQIISGLVLLGGAASAIQAGGRNSRNLSRQAVPLE